MENASASAAGYAYQFERALYRIFTVKHRFARIGIETADDLEEISYVKDGKKRILEQDKISQLKNSPLKDSSRNLWNTLSIWLKEVYKSGDEYTEHEFVLVTNRTVPKDSLAFILSNSKSEDEVAQAIELLREHAGKITGAVEKIAINVCSYEDEDIAYILKNLTVLDGQDGDSLREATYAALQFPSDVEGNEENIYEALIGHLLSSCLASWHNGDAFWAEAQPFFNKKHALCELYINQSMTPLPQEETGYRTLLDDYKDLPLPFFSQLRRILPRESLLNKELGHFWAAYSERTRLLVSGKILLPHINEAESILAARWESITDAHVLVKDKDPSEFTDEDFKEIYIQTSSCDNHFSLKLGRVNSNQRYLFMGTYHHQANESDSKHPIHWHLEQDDSK
ncbi:ABC-three component system protein [Pseudomonas xanthosomatis]|uniref:ABC-three component system protein n=1 Tax=Pseudomonas xanthosomatis TaxID=2842356 RepID=UPI003516BA3D